MFIPVRIRILHLFGRSSFIIGFLFTIIGLSFIGYFSFQINWRLHFAGKGELHTTQGIITSFQETNYQENDDKLFSYNYKYLDSLDSTYFGTFLEFEGYYSIGQDVEVQYLINKSSISRFTGKDRKNLDRIMFLGGVGAVLVGFLFMVPSSRRTRKERKIIMAGIPTDGKLLQAVPTNLRVNDQTVYNLTFEFLADNNSTEKCLVHSHMIQNFTNEHKEKLIYDPRKPSNVVIIDTLPTSVARFILNKFRKSNI